MDLKVEQWFNGSELSEGTKEQYLRYLGIFCKHVNKSPSELIQEAIKEIKQGKLPAERNVFDHLTKFKTHLKNNGLSPNAQSIALAAVKGLYRFYDIPLPSSIIRQKAAKPLKDNIGFLKREDVIKLITASKSLRDKAIILSMATSGMARQEILNLRMKDISFDESEIGIVSVRRQKTDFDYITFISPEAVQALRNYIDERKRSIFKPKDENDYVFVTYDNGTRIDEGTFGCIFRALAEELGYKNGGNQIKSKSHALRKFFSSTLENAGVPKNKVDYMLGHGGTKVDRAYFETEIARLKEIYLKHLPYLTFEKKIEIHTLDEARLSQMEKENEELHGLLEKEGRDVKELKEQLVLLKNSGYREAKLSSENEELKTRLLLHGGRDLDELKAQVQKLEKELTYSRTTIIEEVAEALGKDWKDLPGKLRISAAGQKL